MQRLEVIFWIVLFATLAILPGRTPSPAPRPAKKEAAPADQRPANGKTQPSLLKFRTGFTA